MEFISIKQLGEPRKKKFGSVFLIQSSEDHNLFVLKELQKDKANEHIQANFRNEKEFSFNTPGLPAVISFTENKDFMQLVLSYKAGITLDEFWKSVPKKERVKFLVQFLTQLDQLLLVLRKKNIVHCDLRPANILIDGDLEYFTVHLIDFGLSIKTTKIPNRKLIFPLGYAAPELILNKLSVLDQRTDLFSIGIIIFKLYTDELPLKHKNPSIYTNLQLVHPLVANSKIPKEIFPLLLKLTAKPTFKTSPNRMEQHIVDDILEEAMNKRYKSLGEFIIDLTKILERPKKGLIKFFSKS